MKNKFRKNCNNSLSIDNFQITYKPISVFILIFEEGKNRGSGCIYPGWVVITERVGIVGKAEVLVHCSIVV